jgi:hypothetical protein
LACPGLCVHFHAVYAIYEAEIALKGRRMAVAESAVTYLTTAIAAWRKRTLNQQLREATAGQILHGPR